MGFIRSAREIAVEKVESMGKLSDEERRCLKEQEMGQVGIVLVEKYLGSGDERVLAFEPYSTEERRFLGRLMLERLLQAVELRSPGRLDTVIRGIGRLPYADQLVPAVSKLRDLFGRYQLAEKEVRGQIEREGKEVLHRFRIAGTAVGEINVRARPEWEQKIKGLAEPFVQELEIIKREMLLAVG